MAGDPQDLDQTGRKPLRSDPDDLATSLGGEIKVVNLKKDAETSGRTMNPAKAEDTRDFPWTEDDLTSDADTRRATHSAEQARELRELARELHQHDSK